MSSKKENVVACCECEGTGKIVIYNAYNNLDTSEIDCDYCEGLGEAPPNPEYTYGTISFDTLLDVDDLNVN